MKETKVVDKMDARDQCCTSKVVNSAFCVKKNDESVCLQTRYRLKITKTIGVYKDIRERTWSSHRATILNTYY